MKKMLLFLLLCLFGYFGFSQDYTLNVTWDGVPDCYSGSMFSEFFHTTSIYDVNNNLIDQSGYGANVEIINYTGIFHNVRPYRVVHTFNCHLLYQLVWSASAEVIIPQNGDCWDVNSEDMDLNLTARLSIPENVLNQPNDNEVCNTETLEVSAHNDCSGDTYKWRYSLDGNSFYSFGGVTTGNTVLPTDLGELLPHNYTGNLFIKAYIRYEPIPAYTGETNIITYTIIGCSPNLEDLTAIAETCHGAGDGSFTMTLDRDLVDDELLFVALYAQNQNNPNNYILIDNEDTETLINNKDGTYSYNWPENLAPGNYKIKYQSRYEGDEPDNQSWNSLGLSPLFTIASPEQVTFSLQKLNNVNCFGGSDGRIRITADGGTDGGYQYRVNGGKWVSFSSQHNHTLQGLPEGNYTIEVRDDHKCEGEPENTDHISIAQPNEPVSIVLSQYEEPTAHGFTNGSITMLVNGGTPAYSFQWYDQNNNLVNTASTANTQNGYQITLHDISAGTYTLRVRDANYNQAVQKGGCTHQEAFVLEAPPPLQLSIQKTIPISCNSANTFNNPSSDGQLTAVASGGVPFNPPINGFYKYIYTWKKKNGNNVWQVIPNESTNILNNVDAGEYAVNIEDANGIVVGVYVNNQLQQTQDVVYVMEDPDLLEVALDKTDVNCFGGLDGTATVAVIGGTPPYDIFWATGESTETIENLSPANYWVQVTDARGCQAEGEINIEQPNEPVSLSEGLIQEPLAFGFTNGSVTAYVMGGTPYPNNSYDYEWLDEDNNPINTTTAQHTQDGYQIVLQDIPAGTYTLAVRDANYNNAIQKEGCTYSRNYVVTEPPPLEVTILPVGISCNSANLFNNPTEDGQLTAIASGGVPFEPPIDGLYAYIYTWKKKDGNGIWQVIPNESTDILNNVGEGEYAVNIEDANGIILGTYVNNILQTPQDHIFLLEEPEQLVVELDKTDVSCSGGGNGSAIVSISGGIPPYEIFWSNNGASTHTQNNLLAGTYLVYVMDALGCEVSGQITIEEPEDLRINLLEQVNPTCFDTNEGSIALEVLGGQPPYTFKWDTGDAITSLNGLFEGVYSFEVIDANGCMEFFETELKSPLSSFKGLGADKVLCKDQIAEYDISIEDPNATYLWTSDFGFHSTSPIVSLTESGIYTATVTSGLGCSESDSIAIKVTNVEIDSQFLITSQAFAQEEVVLVNTSNPIGTSEDWVFPEEAKVIEKDRSLAIVTFDEPGVYEVILRSYQGGCYEDFRKSIVVAEARELPDVGDAIAPFIIDFKVYPNPSSGSFTVALSVQEESTISLRLFGLTTNHVYDERLLQGSANYEIPYEINLTSGIYILLLETAKESQIKKIVVL